MWGGVLVGGPRSAGSEVSWDKRLTSAEMLAQTEIAELCIMGTLIDRLILSR